MGRGHIGRHRAPAGIPTGGQFASENRARAMIDVAAEAVIDEDTVDRVIRSSLRAALGVVLVDVGSSENSPASYVDGKRAAAATLAASFAHPTDPEAAEKLRDEIRGRALNPGAVDVEDYTELLLAISSERSRAPLTAEVVASQVESMLLRARNSSAQLDQAQRTPSNRPESAEHLAGMLDGYCTAVATWAAPDDTERLSGTIRAAVEADLAIEDLLGRLAAGQLVRSVDGRWVTAPPVLAGP